MKRVIEMELAVQSFLQSHWDQTRPLVLGYSGGPDSKALLYALHALQIPLHVAHIDHGWRAESAQEALSCAQEAAALGYPFHTCRLSSPASTRNREEAAREARMAFFRSLYQTTPFQALVLAHHRDDLAETVLKRILEGAHLPALGGMRPVTHHADYAIWRPLLSIPKEQIFAYLQSKNLNAMQDASNHDMTFQRNRIRRHLIPEARKALGKEVSSNLSLLSERAYELDAYLFKKLSPFLTQILTPDPSTLLIPALIWLPLERLERRYLLRILFNRMQTSPSRALTESMLDWFETSKPDRTRLSAWSLYIQNGHFTLTLDPQHAISKK